MFFHQALINSAPITSSFINFIRVSSIIELAMFKWKHKSSSKLVNESLHSYTTLYTSNHLKIFAIFLGGRMFTTASQQMSHQLTMGHTRHIVVLQQYAAFRLNVIRHLGSSGNYYYVVTCVTIGVSGLLLYKNLRRK